MVVVGNKYSSPEDGIMIDISDYILKVSTQNLIHTTVIFPVKL